MEPFLDIGSFNKKNVEKCFFCYNKYVLGMCVGNWWNPLSYTRAYINYGNWLMVIERVLKWQHIMEFANSIHSTLFFTIFQIFFFVFFFAITENVSSHHPSHHTQFQTHTHTKKSIFSTNIQSRLYMHKHVFSDFQPMFWGSFFSGIILWCAFSTAFIFPFLYYEISCRYFFFFTAAWFLFLVHTMG